MEARNQDTLFDLLVLIPARSDYCFPVPHYVTCNQLGTSRQSVIKTPCGRSAMAQSAQFAEAPRVQLCVTTPAGVVAPLVEPASRAVAEIRLYRAVCGATIAAVVFTAATASITQALLVLVVIGTLGVVLVPLRQARLGVSNGSI